VTKIQEEERTGGRRQGGNEEVETKRELFSLNIINFKNNEQTATPPFCMVMITNYLTN
jgi:hypothetical protein